MAGISESSLSPPVPRCGRGAVLLALSVGLVTFAAFSPVLGHAFLDAWDDNVAITQNAAYNPPRVSTLVHYWVPPPHDEFFVPVMYTLWGLVAMAARSPVTGTMNPLPFHALNLIGHTLTAVMVFLILRRLVRSDWASAAGALLFALHPIQVEAVAWASSAYTPLSGMLGLAAVWQYLIFSDATDRGERGRPRAHYAVACVAFVLAMLTKPAAVSIPLIAGALEVGFRGRPVRKVLAPLGAWMALSVPIVLATRLGTPAATVGHFEPWQRVVVALDAMGFYVWRILVPVGLSPDYGRSPGWVLGRPVVWLTALIPVGLFVLVRVLRRRAPWLNAAAAVFAVALLPTLGLSPFNFQTFSTVADRYAYLAMFGVAVVVAVLLSRVSAKAWCVPVAMMLAGLGAMSAVQLAHWRNGWSLFAYTLRANPESRIVAGQLRFMFTPEIEAQCDLPAARVVEMADGLMRQKRSALAANVYRMAVGRGANDAATWGKLAVAHVQNDQLDLAARALREAMRIDPGDAQAHALMGDVLARSDVAGALGEYEQALAIDSTNTTARRGIAMLRPQTRGSSGHQ